MEDSDYTVICEKGRLDPLNGLLGEWEDLINLLRCAKCDLHYLVRYEGTLVSTLDQEWQRRLSDLRQLIEAEHELGHPAGSLRHDGAGAVPQH